MDVVPVLHVRRRFAQQIGERGGTGPITGRISRIVELAAKRDVGGLTALSRQVKVAHGDNVRATAEGTGIVGERGRLDLPPVGAGAVGPGLHMADVEVEAGRPVIADWLEVILHRGAGSPAAGGGT